MSIVGELLAQFTNQGVDVWHAGPSGAFVEEEVGRWLCDLVGYGPASFGILTSGGVMANLMAMTRRARRPPGADPRARRAAAWAPARGRPRVRLRPDPLLDRPGARRARLPARDAPRRAGRRSLPAPRRAGRGGDRRGSRGRAHAAGRSRPSPGSTNTGSVDRTEELADVAAREGLWLHVDAAYGGGGAPLVARRGPGVPGLERADSITIDPHKWFFQAYDIGGLLVRRRRRPAGDLPPQPGVLPRRRVDRAGRRSRADGGDHEDGAQLNFYQRSLEGTRRWRALKLWLSWKHLGTSGLGRLVEANDDLAAYLARQIAGRTTSRRCRRARAVGRLLPPPARRAGRGERGSTAAELDAHQDRLRPPSSRFGRRLAGDDAAPRRDLAPGRDRQLPDHRGRHRPAPRRPPPARRRRGPRRAMSGDGRPGAFHVAELNIGRTVAPLDDPALADFVGNLDRINALGDASPGFVWRLQDEFGAATTIRAFDDPLMIVNLTVWESIETLRAFAYRTTHVEFLRRPPGVVRAPRRARVSCSGGSRPDTARPSRRRASGSTAWPPRARPRRRSRSRRPSRRAADRACRTDRSSTSCPWRSSSPSRRGPAGRSPGAAPPADDPARPGLAVRRLPVVQRPDPRDLLSLPPPTIARRPRGRA